MGRRSVRARGSWRRVRHREPAGAGLVGVAVVVLTVALAGLTLDVRTGGDGVLTTSGGSAVGAGAPAADSVGPRTAGSATPVGEVQPLGPAAEKAIRRAQREAARGLAAQEERAWHKARPTGRYAVAGGRDRVPGEGAVVRYLVEVEQGLPVEREQFAAEVHRILNAPGGWGRGGSTVRFVRVSDGPVRFRVSLSSPGLTDRQCAPLRTYGRVSCFNGTRTVLNSIRWRFGSPTYGKDLGGYRVYLVNHEVGHALGQDHEGCPERKASAPVMVQQTKSLEGCRANPWPYPGRVAAG